MTMMPDGSMPTPDGGIVDTGIDQALDDTGVTMMDAGCVQNQGQGGINVPQGTVASGTSCCNWPPSNAIDLNTTTWWDSGGFSGSLTLTFPAPQALTSIHLVAESWPQSNETYTIFGIVNNSPTQIGTSTQALPNMVPTVLKPIAVTPGNYDGIRIDVTSDQSWIGVNEVTLGTTSCP